MLKKAQCKLVFGAALVASFGCEPETAKKELVHGNDCASCHADEALTTTSPPHVEAKFGTDCESCHGQEQWLGAEYTHTMAFPLVGGHGGVACASCHAETYAPGEVPNECVNCHGDLAKAVASPIHAGLSTTCSACHGTQAFTPTTFVHSWPLMGVHAMQECVACHQGNPAFYEGTNTSCYGCHADDKARADANSSTHAMYGTNCESCHGFERF